MEDSHEFDAVIGEYGLENHGLRNLRAAWWNLPSPALYDAAIRNREAVTAHLGPLVVRTGQHTGRSPNDRFIVREPSSENKIWWGKINRAIEIEPFERLRARMLSYLEGRQIFVQDCYAGADPDYQLPIRIITEQAWHNLFARNMFIRELDRAKLRRHVPEFTVIQAPSLAPSPTKTARIRAFSSSSIWPNAWF